MAARSYWNYNLMARWTCFWVQSSQLADSRKKKIHITSTSRRNTFQPCLHDHTTLSFFRSIVSLITTSNFSIRFIICHAEWDPLADHYARKLLTFSQPCFLHSLHWFCTPPFHSINYFFDLAKHERQSAYYTPFVLQLEARIILLGLYFCDPAVLSNFVSMRKPCLELLDFSPFSCTFSNTQLY